MSDVTDYPCRRCGGTGNELLSFYRRCETCGGCGRTSSPQPKEVTDE